MDAVTAIILLVGFSVAVGLLANRYQRSGFGWFLFSVLLTPILGFVFVLALGRRQA
jgi:ABC-type transport system involved in cytochrome c biogenesis permease subunit